jgi:hypothetical protein
MRPHTTEGRKRFIGVLSAEKEKRRRGRSAVKKADPWPIHPLRLPHQTPENDMTRRLLLLTILAVTVAPVRAGERVDLHVTPWVAFAPADLRVRAMVAIDKDNRSLEIIAESESFYRSSEVDLAGEFAPRTTTFEFRSLPGGEYNVRAIVKGVNGRALAVTQQTVRVVSNLRSQERRAFATPFRPSVSAAYRLLLTRVAARATTASGSGVKSSPGLMN